ERLLGDPAARVAHGRRERELAAAGDDAVAAAQDLAAHAHDEGPARARLERKVAGLGAEEPRRVERGERDRRGAHAIRRGRRRGDELGRSRRRQGLRGERRRRGGGPGGGGGGGGGPRGRRGHVVRRLA